MICHPCRRRDHTECLNQVRLGISLSTWCDCRHKVRADLPELEAANRARIAAVVARRKPRPGLE